MHSFAEIFCNYNIVYNLIKKNTRTHSKKKSISLVTMETQYWVNFLNCITPTQKTGYEALSKFIIKENCVPQKSVASDIYFASKILTDQKPHSSIIPPNHSVCTKTVGRLYTSQSMQFPLVLFKAEKGTNHYFWFEHGKEKTFSKQAITLTIEYFNDR